MRNLLISGSLLSPATLSEHLLPALLLGGAMLFIQLLDVALGYLVA